MRIEVTQQDIDNGKQCSACHCPIALALFRLTGDGWKVSYFRAENPDGGRAILPPEAERFAKRFDAIGACGVKPFAFELPGDWKP